MKTFTKINDTAKTVILACSFLAVVMVFNSIAWF